MSRLAQFSLGRRALTALITVAVTVLGVVSLGSLRQELIPSISFPAAAVIGAYPGASPEVVEQQVTAVVEDAVAGLDGVEEITSSSASNVSTTTVMFEYGTNVTTAVADLRGAVQSATAQLPEDVDPEVIAGSLDDLPVVQLAVAGDADAAELQGAVDDILVPTLEDLDGVRSVTLTGVPEREVVLDVDMAALTAAGLTPDQVLGILDDNGVRIPAGTLTEGEQTLSVQVGTPLTDVAELAALPLTSPTGATLKLDDVADVVDQEAEPTSISRVDGEPSLAVGVTKTPDANVVEVSRTVEDALADLTDRLDAQGVSVSVVFDQAPFITESIQGLATEGGLGLIFAVVVILLFLASWRSTAVSAVSIPVSLLVAFTVMNATGNTLNLLTLAALTIAIGRVVDDSIVVIENISRHLSYGEDRRGAVLGAVREVAGAITASTLATVAVFLPIGFVGGFVGELFRPFAFTVAIAMGASLFVALTIVPVLAYWFLRARTVATDEESARAVRAAAEAKERRGLWQRAYLPLLGASLRRPVVALGVAVAVLAGTVALVPRLETNLIGDTGQDTLTVTTSFEPGTSLEAQDDVARTVESALLDVDDVATVQTTVGSGGPAALFGGGSESATFALTLAEDADGTRAADAVREAVEPLAEDPATEIDVSTGGLGLGGSTVDLIVTADQTDTLRDAAQVVQEAAEESPEARAVTNSLTADQPVVQVSVDRDAAAAAGLTEAAVATTVAGMMTDPEVGTVELDGAPVTVTASFGEGPASVDELKAVPLTGPAGVVPLEQVADVEMVETPSAITRTDGRRTVTVSVTPAGQDVGALTTDLTQRVDGLDLPEGAEVTVGGLAADQADAFSQLGLALVLAIAIVYIVLVATFNSLLQPFILLVSIPFAATGAVAGLLLTGTPLGVPALIGLLMLVGIVVSNAIVLIDLINQYRERGRSLDEAVTEGARKRLRPIVMTAAATVFALLPMAFGITGGGAFISQPLAVVVIGGLITSTLLTLVVVPVIYVLVERRRERRRARHSAAAAPEPTVAEPVG
ncbi:efflux RND transporter permease subunit [Georgenia sp. TF02-10]|uniref:efflux RND transporter permease subunit n=1 Tax=Georgenia sp. TF02-10 TaxID=2917725 RepID=UPI001FA7C7A5|nr:efflux RND transporter permease subunit [Georgenia sp. TF02-10]UNX55360.1 efflux RND transporter permease subunit [Georgenia sp. TF02-10]